jgi:hypothetical protein
MKTTIIQEETRTIEHRRNQKAKKGDKGNIRVPLFRGLDTATYNYMLRNKYYSDRILTQNNLGFLIEQRKKNFPNRYIDFVATA